MTDTDHLPWLCDASDRHGVEPSPEIKAGCYRTLAFLGANEAAKKLRIDRTTLYRAALGMPIRRGSVALLEATLPAALEAAELAFRSRYLPPEPESKPVPRSESLEERTRLERELGKFRARRAKGDR